MRLAAQERADGVVSGALAQRPQCGIDRRGEPGDIGNTRCSNSPNRFREVAEPSPA